VSVRAGPVIIPRTDRVAWPGATFARDVESEANISVTIWLREKRDGAIDAERARALGSIAPNQRVYADRAILRRETDADDEILQRVCEYCANFGIRLIDRHWRSIVVSGPLDRLIAAFGATVALFADGDGRLFRHRSGPLSVTEDVAGWIRGVFGLHQWPRSRRLGRLQRHATPLSAADVAQRYAFPDADGSGETIGIVQLRGEFRGDDFDRSMGEQGISAARPSVKRIDNAALTHERQTVKDLEAALDEQIVASLAPGARVVIYQAPDDERGMLDAIRTAIFDAEYSPSILSISYGWPEYLWTPVALDLLDELFSIAALLGISIFCASGDNGAELDDAGKAHVLAPASSPFAQACGATVIADAAESAWERSGGGVSARFEAPPWQTGARSRGVPDFAAQQSPGYCVFLDGVELAAGGTSAVAPMWSALAARLNQRLKTRIGFFAPLLYTHPALLHDIVEGGNARYSAGPGWDPCTGLGVPIGTAIESALRAERS
jgi:kumamolisin